MVSSRVYPGLERKPGGPDNWVEATGGLPSYIERIAKHLHYEQGFSISRAIATAVNTVKRWAAGGTVTEHGTTKRVSAKTQATALKALAEWEAKKRAAGALNLSDADISDTDTMVALMLPGPVQSKLAVADGVPVADLHVTVTFHGELDDAKFNALTEAVGSFTKDWSGSTLKGTIGGIGTFPATDEDQGSPWWVPVDVPGLSTLHDQIEAVSDKVAPASTDHGYTPHITLAYVKDGESPPDPVPSTPVAFDSVWVVRGNTQRIEYKFGGQGGADLTERAILASNQIDLARGMVDVKALAKRTGAIKDPVQRAAIRKRVLDLAVPSSKLTVAKRKQYAAKGQSLPSGKFPVFDRTSLKSAIRLARTPAQRAHIMRRARALGLSSMIPDKWHTNLSEVLREAIDLSSTIPPKRRQGSTKDKRPSFKRQGKWGHGFVPLDQTAKEAKAKGSPIAMKRMNRLFSSSGGKHKAATGRAGDRSAHNLKRDGNGGPTKIEEKGTSESAKTLGQLRNTKFEDTRKTKSEGSGRQKEASKQTRVPKRAKQNWDEIPENLKTVRNGKRYVVATFGGKQVITEWVGGVHEIDQTPLSKRIKYRTLSSADAAAMTTAQIRALLKNPNTTSPQVRKLLNKTLAAKVAKEKQSG